MEALNKYTIKALNGSQTSISLLNTEVTQIHKAVLQNRMTLGILTAAQGGTCALSKQNAVYTSQIITRMSQDY